VRTYLHVRQRQSASCTGTGSVLRYGMNFIRKAWTYGLSPSFMRVFNFWAMIFFIVQIPLILTSLKSSVPYLVAISVWANIAGHLSAWQSSRVEERQEAED
jgi:hypothetical protein